MYKKSTLLTLTAGLAMATSTQSFAEEIDFGLLTAKDAAELICEKKVTSEALVKHYLERIKYHSDLNAFITVMDEQALDKAREWDKHIANGGACLPLGGVPVAIKDNTHVAGVPNTAGTPALKNFVPKENAPVVQKLINAGAIIIGKTNMHELAWGATGYNTAFHIDQLVGVRNAANPTRIAGGSSSGSASAVAANLVPIAMGTDTGASVREPCALNGCVGFRPTVGRYDTEAITPISTSRDTPGPMAKTVNDIRLIDSILTTKKDKVVNFDSISDIRLGLPDFYWNNLTEEVKLKANSAIEVLKAHGIQLVTVSLPNLQHYLDKVSMPVPFYESKKAMETYLKKYDVNISIEKVAEDISSPDVKALFDNFIMPEKLPGNDGKLIDLKPAYEDAVNKYRPELLALYEKVFKQNKLDGLVFPSTPAVAPLANEDVLKPEVFTYLIRNNDPGSNIKMPGLTLPIGNGEYSDMPIGLEIDGLPDTDQKILAIGEVFENILKK